MSDLGPHSATSVQISAGHVVLARAYLDRSGTVARHIKGEDAFSKTRLKQGRVCVACKNGRCSVCQKSWVKIN